MSLSATRARYDGWLARRGAVRVEVVAGMGAALSYGALEDGEIIAGQAFTAGGYGEERTAYLSPLFRPADGSEPRTVHLGLDIFAPPGAAVLAPLAGRVHSFADNDRPGDYGPTLILEHAPQPGLLFWTLYGHLAKRSLETFAVGAHVSGGQRIGALGGRTENGGWPAHLHLQVILDLTVEGAESRGDFPGVCRRTEAASWLMRCPDPAGLIGLRVA